MPHEIEVKLVPDIVTEESEEKDNDTSFPAVTDITSQVEAAFKRIELGFRSVRFGESDPYLNS